MDIGKIIEKRRGELYMTRDELAGKLGISPDEIACWERGDGYPDTPMIPVIARALGISSGRLMGDRMSDISMEVQGRLFSEEHMYTYVRTAAVSRELYQTARVLPLARKYHEGQVRKGEDRIPYIYHPLLMACHMMALGIYDDDMLSACLLHDVC